MFLDYNNVTVIPAGATNIDIRQHGYRHVKEDENYLGNYSNCLYFLKFAVKLESLFSFVGS